MSHLPVYNLETSPSQFFSVPKMIKRLARSWLSQFDRANWLFYLNSFAFLDQSALTDPYSVALSLTSTYFAEIRPWQPDHCNLWLTKLDNQMISF